MAVITISRYFGAGGITLGKRLAKELDYHFINDQLINEVAEKAGVSSEQIQCFEKRGTTKLDRLLDFVVSSSFIERHSDKHGYVTAKKYVDEVREVILNIYEQGNAVIIGRGSNYALQGKPRTVHVLLIADMRHRIRFLMENYGMTEEQADKAIKRADMIRRNFLDCFDPSGNHDDPRLYTMVLNMNQITMDQSAAFIKDIVQSC